jgi:hypothetical protein
VGETTKNEFLLMERIVQKSIADNFQEAKLEWILVSIVKGNDECLCGHSPIKNLCILRNKNNCEQVIVGSTCVQKFIGIKTEPLFVSYKIVLDNEEAYLGKELIEYLHEHGIINDWEHDFLMSTIGKKFEWLTEKQQLKRIQINKKVIDYMNRQVEKIEKKAAITPSYKPDNDYELDDDEQEEFDFSSDEFYRDLLGY